MPTNARKQHIIGTGGPWGTGLLYLGLFGIFYGFGNLLRGEDLAPAALQEISETVPLEVWACGWLAAGLYAVSKALRPPQKHADTWPLVGMSIIWTGAFTVHWLIDGATGQGWSYEWLGGTVWLLLVGILVSWGRCINPLRAPAGR